jgi:AAHS family 4-hydroxybenzoate transporter-like MFS transporter
MQDMATAVDIDSFVDGLKFNRFHLLVLVICTLMMTVDGYDLALVGWVLPKVSDDFGVPRTAMAWALTAQQIGLVIGAFGVAPLADKIGRRHLLIACIIGVGISLFATIFANGVTYFTVCRAFTGIFASAILTNLISIVSEIAPGRMRGTMGTIVLAGSMGGALLGSLMQAFILVPFGWRAAFMIGTALPVVMLLPILFFLPETLKFLVARNPDDPAINILARRMQPAGAPEVVIVPVARVVGEAAPRTFIADLFAKGRASTTVLLWLAFIANFLFIATNSSWGTTFFKDVVHLPWKQVALTTAIYTTGGMIGTIFAGIAIDRLGFKPVIVTLFLISAVAIICIGQLAPRPSMFIAQAVMAFAAVGGHVGLASLATTLYPSSHRATGVGWAYGAGRVSSIIGPSVGAFLLHEGWGARGIYTLLAFPLALTGVVVFCLLSLPQNRHKRPAAKPAKAAPAQTGSGEAVALEA